MKVFISYSHEDIDLAFNVSNALEKNGLQVWNADRELLPGDNWASETARALDEAEAMVVLMTPSALASRQVKREIEYALGAKNFSNRLILLAVGDRERLPKNEIPWIVKQLPWFGLADSEIDPPHVEPIAKAILGHA